MALIIEPACSRATMMELARKRLSACFVIALYLVSCAGPARRQEPAPAQPKRIDIDWSAGSFRTDLEAGWSVAVCGAGVPMLCVDRGGKPVGSVLLKDLPSLGEEKTTSAAQVQAVLAGRINSLYQFKAGRWASACGQTYRVGFERPKKIRVGGHDGMKYELSGQASEVLVENVLGYWTYRDGIETVIEASGRSEGRCVVEALAQTTAGSSPGPAPEFSPEDLAAFEPYLDRIARQSKLPPATRFTERPKG